MKKSLLVLIFLLNSLQGYAVEDIQTAPNQEAPLQAETSQQLESVRPFVIGTVYTGPVQYMGETHPAFQPHQLRRDIMHVGACVAGVGTLLIGSCLCFSEFMGPHSCEVFETGAILYGAGTTLLCCSVIVGPDPEPVCDWPNGIVSCKFSILGVNCEENRCCRSCIDAGRKGKLGKWVRNRYYLPIEGESIYEVPHQPNEGENVVRWAIPVQRGNVLPAGIPLDLSQ